MTTPTIGVIDYKAGNAPSVLNALRHLEVPAVLISTKAQLDTVDRLVLPGVGSAAATMASLGELDMLDTLEQRVIRAGVPFLGICVGLQILFDHSDEDDAPCLGWIPGQVRRFSEELVRIPQMGWNRVTFKDERPSAFYYFVNSYHAVPADERVVAATAEYGYSFCAMIKHNNIAATQFHLEKSGAAGLRLLKELVCPGGASW